MTLFQQLVNRGNAVMNEWNSNEGFDTYSNRMAAEIAAATLVSLCGQEMKNWTPEQRNAKAKAIKTAISSAFQIGRNSSPVKYRKRRRA